MVVAVVAITTTNTTTKAKNNNSKIKWMLLNLMMMKNISETLSLRVLILQLLLNSTILLKVMRAMSKYCIAQMVMVIIRAKG